MSNNITIVTGIWNIGRDNAGDGFKRQFSHYISKFNDLLNSLSDQNVIVYIEKNYVDKIPHHSNHKIYEREIGWFTDNFDFYNQVQTIRKNQSWLNQVGWLRNSTQASLELYNPLVMSKYFLLNDATIFNPFNTDYFVWLDGGITNTIHPGYFYKDKILDKLKRYLDPFLFVSFPYTEGPEIHGFPREKMNEYCNVGNVEYVCRGGIFGGHKKIINEYNSYYYNLLRDTLNSGYMGTEESIFTIMSHLKPEIFKRSTIDSNGLLGKFFENLKNDNITLLPEERYQEIIVGNKVSIYTISFNSPDQFEKSCISWSEDTSFSQCRKILINNSTDKTLDKKYQDICDTFSFEQINMEKNLGICGGRQFVADHFDKSDSDFCIFLEDDMFLNSKNYDLCINGFRKYIPNLIDISKKIISFERYDYLKFCFTEFFGDNSTQWAWYNVPQNVREKYFPNNPTLPKIGIDKNSPKTMFKNIKSLNGVSYADGEIYYCNWPHMTTKIGNRKMFLDTRWSHPFEQTWMSHMFQLSKEGRFKSAILLASPITHDRFDHYPPELRKEN